MINLDIVRSVSLKPFVTLRAGGAAEQLVKASTRDSLVHSLQYAIKQNLPLMILGSGSNVLPADQGVSGLVILNRTREIQIEPDGTVIVDSGVPIQDLFLKTAQASLTGFEFAVGIPGSVGGALASNAGAYRRSVSESLVQVEIGTESGVGWVDPEWLKLSYRDSILRHEDKPICVVTRLKFHLAHGCSKAIYDDARDHQRQRISKQPPPASAGSFFKNVNDVDLAESLPNLPASLKKAGVVPAGYLIEAAGLRGHRQGGAMFSSRHANFIVNVGDATATEIRALAGVAKAAVFEKFGVLIEEEALYIGDWPREML